MRSRHNDILQDDDEFTSLAATSPTIITISFTITSPAALGYGALFTLDNANLYSNQRGGAAINNLGKIRDNFSFDRAADQLTRPGLTHNGDQVYHQPVALTYSFLTQSALNCIGQTGDGDRAAAADSGGAGSGAEIDAGAGRRGERDRVHGGGVRRD